MPANTAPIFPLAPVAAWATLTAANTAKDGTGAVALIYTAGANGSFVEMIRATSLGTNVASVLRIFLNNGLTNATAANNSLVYEIALPATTVLETSDQAEQVITVQVAIPAGYRLYATIGTAVAAGWQVSTLGGDY